MDFDINKMQQMLSQAKQMQEQMSDNLAATIVEADSGGGAVTVRMNGNKQLLKLTIAPSAASAAASDMALLEDLIVAAINSAQSKAEAAQQSSTSNLLGNLNLPGL